mmetsp:Transcript_51991/g.111154  ORF Transcript_51991/g.111154 Transcript_51991/m.111154 type:complete len:205 (+) Transcript_51991:226-840(+)
MCRNTSHGRCTFALQVILQFIRTARRPHLLKRSRFNLPHPFPCDGKPAPNFLKRARSAVIEAVPQSEYVRLALCQLRIQHCVDVLSHHAALQVGVRHRRAISNARLQRRARPLRLLLAAADGLLHRDRRERRITVYLAQLSSRDTHASRDLRLRGRPAQHRLQLAPVLAQLVHQIMHVHRHADGARLIGDGSRDGLANPPRGVR